MLRVFRFQAAHTDGGIDSPPINRIDMGAEDQITGGGIGYPIGDFTLEDGTVVDGGRLLRRSKPRSTRASLGQSST
jgi:hypothetical protein